RRRLAFPRWILARVRTRLPVLDLDPHRSRAAAAVFLPVYLFVIVPGPILRRHGEHPRLRGFIKGATAAAAGAIAGAAIVIGEQVIATAASVAIAMIALALLLQRRI